MRPSAALLLFALVSAACTIVRESNPPRTATEQLLISTAVDRAVEGMHFDIPKGTSVFVDPTNLDGYDSKYAIASITERILQQGAQLSSDRAKADMVVALRAGALSTDSVQDLVGLPSIGGVPVPLMGTLSLPEIALIKKEQTRGVAKFAATVYDSKTGELKSVSGASYGLSSKTHWFIILVGWDRSDIAPPVPATRAD